MDEWDRSNKRQKIFVRALGGSGRQGTISSAFPYLPEIAYLSILCRIFTIMKMLQKLAIYVIAYLGRLQGKYPTATNTNPEARKNNLIRCRMRTQQLLSATRWWIASVCIFEDGRLQWAEEARRLRDPMPSPHAEAVRQRFLDYGVLADELLPKDLKEVGIGKKEVAKKHELVRSLEWLYSKFKTLFCEEELAPEGTAEDLRLALEEFLEDFTDRELGNI